MQEVGPKRAHSCRAVPLAAGDGDAYGGAAGAVVRLCIRASSLRKRVTLATSMSPRSRSISNRASHAFTRSRSSTSAASRYEIRARRRTTMEEPSAAVSSATRACWASCSSPSASVPTSSAPAPSSALGWPCTRGRWASSITLRRLWRWLRFASSTCASNSPTRHASRANSCSSTNSTSRSSCCALWSCPCATRSAPCSWCTCDVSAAFRACQSSAGCALLCCKRTVDGLAFGDFSLAAAGCGSPLAGFCKASTCCLSAAFLLSRAATRVSSNKQCSLLCSRSAHSCCTCAIFPLTTGDGARA
mmetsp:Transcript_4847/g.17565  ORF Transcript_4847/g.17565 Transcript_4847/m.17565 type:complete len:303 (+) Transcript_4847:127-1035(+)